jgi:riboflavin kinase/FMN adenylyltransferase
VKVIVPPPYPFLSDSIVTVGSFDGIHLGHARLIRRAVAGANRDGLPAVLLTFSPHPQEVLKGRPLPQLLSPADREALLASLGVQVLVYWPFSTRLMSLSPEEFVERLLVPHFRPRAVFVGFNFTFGHRAKGTAETLRALGHKAGFEVWVEPPVTVDGLVVSSSAVRAALGRGDVLTARRLLGYWPFLRGRVAPGEGRGRHLGFPTANLEPPEEVLCPQEGVYAAFADLGPQRWPAVLNIGHRPTFGCDLPRTVEVFLLDYRGEELYGRELRVEFRGRLRPERRFTHAQELAAQIARDVAEARRLLTASVEP